MSFAGTAGSYGCFFAMPFKLKIDRRTVCKVLGAMPFLGWLDPLRAIEQHACAVQYRAHRDGRSLFIMLRDFIRNGASHEDLARILGPFKIAGRIDPTPSEPLAIDTTDKDVSALEHGDCLIEYPMSFWHVQLRLRDGALVDHDPSDFETYPDGLYLTDRGLEAYGRPPEGEPLPSGAGIYCEKHGPQRVILVCAHISRAITTGESIPCYLRDDETPDRPDAWCHACEQRLLALLPDKSIDDWNRSCEPAICCAACLDLAKQEF